MHFFLKNQEVQNLVDLIFWSFRSQIGRHPKDVNSSFPTIFVTFHGTKTP